MVKKKKMEFKEILTHIVAIILIISLITLLILSAFNQDIEIPALLISLGSSAVGFYLSKQMKF